jgi:hypothetical protein
MLQEWTWRLGRSDSGLPVTFRAPPAPYREKAHARPGLLLRLGQPVYQFGRHVDLWNKRPNKRATWYCACVIAWQFWSAPSEWIQTPLFRRLQARRSGETGGRLWKNAKVNHRVPLFRVPVRCCSTMGSTEPTGHQSRCSRANAGHFDRGLRRHIQDGFTARPASLGPKLIEGLLPQGMGVTRLADLPV